MPLILAGTKWLYRMLLIVPCVLVGKELIMHSEIAFSAILELIIDDAVSECLPK